MSEDSYQPMFGEPIAEWFRWFAWRPVCTIDRGWRWLRPVWRRRCRSHDYLDGPLVEWWQNAVTR